MKKSTSVVVLLLLSIAVFGQSLQKENAMKAFAFLASQDQYNAEIDYPRTLLFMEKGISEINATSELKAFYEIIAENSLWYARETGNNLFYRKSIKYYELYRDKFAHSSESNGLSQLIKSLKNEGELNRYWLELKEKKDIIDYDILADASVGCPYIYQQIRTSEYEDLKYADIRNDINSGRPLCLEKAQSYLIHFPQGQYVAIIKRYIAEYKQKQNIKDAPLVDLQTLHVEAHNSGDEHLSSISFKNSFLDARAFLGHAGYSLRSSPHFIGSENSSHRVNVVKGSEDFFYCEYKNGRIFRPIDEYASDRYTLNNLHFSDGYLCTRLSSGKNRAFIDLNGAILFDAACVSPEPFIEGYSCWDKKGIVDKSGKYIIKKGQYTRLNTFSEGVAIGYHKKGYWAVINTQGQEVATVNDSDITDIAYMREGMAVFAKNGLFGFIDSSGTIAIPPIYNSVSDFRMDMAVVSIAGKYGVINKKGKLLIPFDYDFISSRSYSNRVFYAQKNKENIYISSNNHFRYAPKSGNRLRGNCAYYTNDDYQLYNILGQSILPLGIASWFSSGNYGTDGTLNNGRYLIVQNKEKKVGSIDLWGNTIIPFIYSNILPASSDGKYCQVTKKNADNTTTYYCYNAVTNSIIDYGDPWCNSYLYYDDLRVKKFNDSSYIVNEYGNRVGDYAFDELMNFHHGIAQFKIKNTTKSGFVDRNGEILFIKVAADGVFTARNKIIGRK